MTDAEIRASWEREALRDQFAAAALTGLLADAGLQRTLWAASKSANKPPAFLFALLAYDYADAMMARRAQATADAPAPASTAP